MLDLVIVLAAHASESVDVLFFNQQRIAIDTSAAAPGRAPRRGTSYTTIQQTVNITRIRRVKGVVTVAELAIAGEHVQADAGGCWAKPNGTAPRSN